LSGDLLSRGLSATIAAAISGKWTVSVAGPLSLSVATEAVLHLPATQQSLPLTFQSDAAEGQLFAELSVAAGTDPSGAELCLEGGLVLTASVVVIADAAGAGTDVTGFGVVAETPVQDVVNRTLAALALGKSGGPGPKGNLGHWQLGADGRVAGWSIDLSTGTALAVDLLLNGIVVDTHPSDMAVRILAGLPDGVVFPLAVPCGFAFDIANVGHAGGLVRIEVQARSGALLPAPAPVRLKLPLKAVQSAVDPWQAFGLPQPPQLDEAEVALLLAPVAADLSQQIALTFGLKVQPEGSLASVLSEARRRLSTDASVLAALGAPGRQLDPALWSPAVTLPFEVLERLPLAPQTRDVARKAQNWRAFLRCLVSDPILFPMVSDRGDWLQARGLWRLRRAAGVSATAEPISLAVPLDAEMPLPAAFTGADRLLLLDTAGSVALDMVPAILRTALAVRLTEIAARLAQDFSPARCAGWLMLVVSPDGRAQISDVTWQDARRTPSAPTDPRAAVLT